MRRFLSTTALLLALGFSVAARSEEPSRPSEAQEVFALAQQLKRSVQSIEGFADMSALGRGRSGSMARSSVERFLREARHFRMKAGHDLENGEMPSQNDFQRLLDAYDSASRAAQWLEFYGSAGLDMSDVNAVMKALMSRYRD